MPGKNFISLIVLLFGLACSWRVASEESLRDRVVAGFVFNFLKFTEWPALAENAPINLCAAAEPEMFAILSEFSGKTVVGRELRVIDNNAADSVNCQVLFIAKGAKSSCNCHCFENSPQLLLISDNPGYTDNCGIIGLYEDENHLRFEINLHNAERSGIRFRSQLLQLARIIKDGKP